MQSLLARICLFLFVWRSCIISELVPITFFTWSLHVKPLRPRPLPEYNSTTARVLLQEYCFKSERNYGFSFSSPNYNHSTFLLLSFTDFICYSRVYSRIYWYPAKKTESYEVVKCCPGWSNYVINVGCTKSKYDRHAVDLLLRCH